MTPAILRRPWDQRGDDTKDTEGHIVVVDRDDVLSWNPCNTWQKISSHPDTYIPIGMKKSAPMDEAHGKWVVDPQDHSRFYVPAGGLTGVPEDFLAEQARIATNHPAGALLPLLFLFDAAGAVARSGH